MSCYLDPLFFICWALTDSGDVIFFVCNALVDFSTVLLLLPYQEQERAVRCKADDLLAELQHDVFEADPFAWLKDTLEKLPTVELGLPLQPPKCSSAVAISSKPLSSSPLNTLPLPIYFPPHGLWL